MKNREYHFRMLVDFIFHPFPIHHYAIKLSRLIPKFSKSQGRLRIKTFWTLISVISQKILYTHISNLPTIVYANEVKH